VLTTTVSAKYDDVGAADRRQIGGDLRRHFEIAIGARHPQPMLLHGAQMRTASKEDDVGAGFREPRPDVSANRPRPDDDNSHGALCV
jgi:hypothetical protein